VDEMRRLHEEIARCQRLAAGMSDAKTLIRLRAYIKELEEQARRLEDKMPPQTKST
jgi:hypothetical protein